MNTQDPQLLGARCSCSQPCGYCALTSELVLRRGLLMHRHVVSFSKALPLALLEQTRHIPDHPSWHRFGNLVLQASKSWESSGDDWLSSKWSGFKSPRQQSRIRKTGVDVEVLRSIGRLEKDLHYDAQRGRLGVRGWHYSGQCRRVSQ